MRAKAPVAPIGEHHEPMIERAVKHVVAHVAPMGGGLGNVALGIFEHLLHRGDAHRHQPRIAVRAAALIGDPIGPEIALFKDMHRNRGRARDPHRLGMDVSGIAVEHDIGYPLLVDQRGKARGPGRLRLGIGDVACAIGPEGGVAPVEANPPDRCPGSPQHRAEPGKKRPMRPLKEQKDPALPVDTRHAFPAAFP